MSSFEERLELYIKRQGENSPVVQLLSDQISVTKRDAFTDRDRQSVIAGSNTETNN